MILVLDKIMMTMLLIILLLVVMVIDAGRPLPGDKRGIDRAWGS